MDQTNQQQDIFQTIKIRNFTTKELLVENLQNYNSQAEFKLSIKFCPQANSLLNLIASQFNKFHDLQSLQIKLDNLFEFDLLEFFGNLRFLQNLESISITILRITIKKLEIQQTIGECIEDLINLKNLNLMIDYKTFYGEENILSLQPAYKKLLNLKKLQLDFINLRESSNIATMFDGINLLVDLNQLEIKWSGYRSKDDLGFKSLCEQIRCLVNLKTLKILVDNKILEAHNYYIPLNQSFTYLKSLENLNLKFSIGPTNDQCFIRGLLQIEQLKNLNIEILKIQSLDIFKQYLDVISKISIKTESIILKFTISSLVDQQLFNEITFYLNKIQNLKELHFSCYYLEIPQHSMLEFLKNLSCLKTLQKLSFHYQNKRQQDKFYYEIKEELFEVLQGFNTNFINLIDFELLTQQNEENNFWISILSSISSLKKIKITPYSGLNSNILKPIDLKDLIINKQNLEIISLKLSKSFQINQSMLIQFLNQLTLHHNLQQLSLNFDWNESYNDQLLQQIKKSIKNLKSLTKLVLYLSKQCNFSLKGVSQLNKGLKCLKNLEQLNLNLEKVVLQGNDFSVLFESLKMMVRLKYLNLNYGISNGEECDIKDLVVFPTSLKDITIQIKKSDLHYKQVKGLIQGLEPLNNLRNLNLKFNLIQFEEIDLLEMQRVLSNLKSLQRLSLFINQVRLLKLIYLFKELQYLEMINMLDCKSSINFLDFYKIELQNNEKIEQVNFQNQFYSSKQGIQLCFKSDFQLEKKTIELMKKFFQMNQLSGLKINFNYKNGLDDSLVCDLFSSFQNLKNLQFLDLQILTGCQIGNSSLNQLGLAMQELTYLILFSIEINDYKNNISISQISQFTNSLKYLINLKGFKIILSLGTSFDLKILLESLKYLVDLKYLHLQVKRCNLFNEDFFIFNKDYFQKLNQIDIIIRYYGEKSRQLSEFYHNLRNLQNLRMITTLPNQISIQEYYKIKQLVKIKLNHTFLFESY